MWACIFGSDRSVQHFASIEVNASGDKSVKRPRSHTTVSAGSDIAVRGGNIQSGFPVDDHHESRTFPRNGLEISGKRNAVLCCS